MNADIRKAIANASESVSCISDMVAALHFIAAPWLIEQIDGRDMLQIKALGDVLYVLSDFVKHTEVAMENLYEVAVKATGQEDQKR